MGELQRFVAELLEEHGAVVEPVEPEGLDVLAPPAVQQILDVPEVARFGFAAELPPDARRVGLEPDWLERLERLLGEHGRYARLVAAPEMPPLNAPERIVEHTVQLPNATWRLIGVRPAWTRYLLLTFRCTALSDEKRDSTSWRPRSQRRTCADGGPSDKLRRIAGRGAANRVTADMENGQLVAREELNQSAADRSRQHSPKTPCQTECFRLEILNRFDRLDTICRKLVMESHVINYKHDTTGTL
jgi:hypothetical protein